MSEPVLSIRDLSISFLKLTPVKSVSFDVKEGEILGIVGESGSGKSLSCLAIAGLLPAMAHASGTVTIGGHAFEASDLPGALASKMLPPIGMIFQEPVSCLNPVRTVGEQIAEAARSAGHSAEEARKIALQLLKDVAIDEPEKRYHYYPSQFSGGMCQRVMIATALALEPHLVIADEPTTALDVTVQAQVVSLLVSLVRKRGIAMIFISHDLDLIAEVCDRIVVMYGGEIMEIDTTENIYERPSHPYTRLLLDAMPGHGEPLTRLVEMPQNWRREAVASTNETELSP
ncbi:ABC transporter ATP-binding protein (plasmid) [Agrobacterium tumefaciens]|uniref:ABC transporter ATP-binding protein n=1 Tax=Agrobacterium TaxID=357 RepID=UPI001297FC5D|nr:MULTISPECIES: ABC transporter ATP-binding protein [Agrobacterium]MQB13426.1 ABC transporter ATP-binding protein [Agrobacterium sp. ICMP 6402]NSZ19983.1 ABC transporter ATP-binding protein [Agrobacterium vitis]QZO07019.1 ABC transporter ATP-binding protein [Agrobacterium vitis]UJL91278.1 ABC transporter ATP-binding protein [Agrobacterium vitis]UXT69261.1 ABC transporter ATP-binding protein [Agrobacterium tumefaciens]